MLKAVIGDSLDPLLHGTSNIIQRLGLGPNSLTSIGLGLNGLAAWDLAAGNWHRGSGLILLAGFFDILDGAMARNCGQASSFGSFLDSVLDRYSDLGLLIGLLIYYSRQGSILYQVLVGVALMGTALVPYTRARAEILVPKCNVGIMERPERILLVLFGAAISSIMPIIVWILAIFTNLTVMQRIYYTWRQMKSWEQRDRSPE
jgi:CDP-diacylglycerol--glycerol-3-phosphate 3-phosphatidyltransferase